MTDDVFTEIYYTEIKIIINRSRISLNRIINNSFAPTLKFTFTYMYLFIHTIVLLLIFIS